MSYYQMNTRRLSCSFPLHAPIHEGQPFSVGLFHCGDLRSSGGFCGFLWTSQRGMVARSRPDSALSWPFFSRPRQHQNLEVRKHQNFVRYKSVGYSRTFKAVGWRHCLAGGNHQPVGYDWAQNERYRSVCMLDTPNDVLCESLSGRVLLRDNGIVRYSVSSSNSHSGALSPFPGHRKSRACGIPFWRLSANTLFTRFQ